MFNRREYKQTGKKAFKLNYWQCVVTALLFLIICGGSTVRIVSNLRNDAHNSRVSTVLSETALGDTVKKLENALQFTDSDAGVFSVVAHEVQKTGSGFMGVLGAVNEIVFGGDIGPKLLAVLAISILIIFFIFVRNIIEVGNWRFFIENQNYRGTKVSRNFFPYHVKRTAKTAKTMFMRDLFNALWAFTIIGGIIKRYSYRMVAPIIAENPDIGWHDAMRMSKEMMHGNKWNAFVMDISFLGWLILSSLTMGLLKVLYVEPYMRASGAAMYFGLREQYNAKAQNTQLNDAMLVTASAGGDIYPEDYFEKRFGIHPSKIAINELREYSVLDYLMIFFSFMMIGYVYEVIYAVLTTGEFVNRGTMYGPWLPIYGFGGTLALILLKRLRTHPIVTFCLSVVMCGIMEYTTAWYLETFKHTKYWDYSGFFGNIQGRVCLEGLTVFGLGCTIAIYVVAPSLASLFDKIPKKVKVAVSAVITVVFLIDLVVSHIWPNMAAGVPIVS